MSLTTLRSCLALALLTLVAGIAAAETAPARPDQKAPVVMVEPAKITEMADMMTYPARSTSKIKAVLSAPADGVVDRVAVGLGSPVRVGQRLMQVKNTDPGYDYVPVAVDAPLAGVISAIEVTAGARVTKGQALATITDPRQLRLVVEIPASDVAAFRPGATGRFNLPVIGERYKNLPVRIVGLSPLIDPATGTATAELEFDGAGGKDAVTIPLGALGKVSFALNKRRGIQIPEQAIVYRGKDTLVRTVVDGKAKTLPVAVVGTHNGLTEIASGLVAGAAVIVRASGFVADGQPVVVQTHDADGDVAHK